MASVPLLARATRASQSATGISTTTRQASPPGDGTSAAATPPPPAPAGRTSTTAVSAAATASAPQAAETSQPLRPASTATPAVPASPPPANSSAPGALAPAELVDAWRQGFAATAGDTFAWWYAGTLYAHVDGLREFPVLALNAVMTCKTSLLADAIMVDWHTVGYFSNLDSGEPAIHWENVFTGKRQAVPPRFAEGPGRYGLSTQDAVLTLSAENVRTNRITLTGNNTADGLMLTQIEGTLQGVPRLDGTLPPLDSRDITERQTRLQLVIPQRAPPPSQRHSGASQFAGVGGFFNHVYDALPPWLGFGDRLGSALSKGVMRKALAGEVVNPAVRSRLHHLFGAAASAKSPKFDR